MQVYIYFLGDLNGCAFRKRMTDCPIYPLDFNSVDEKLKWFENLSIKEKDAIMNHHRECTYNRQKNHLYWPEPNIVFHISAEQWNFSVVLELVIYKSTSNSDFILLTLKLNFYVLIWLSELLWDSLWVSLGFRLFGLCPISGWIPLSSKHLQGTGKYLRDISFFPLFGFITAGSDFPLYKHLITFAYILLNYLSQPVSDNYIVPICDFMLFSLLVPEHFISGKGKGCHFCTWFQIPKFRFLTYSSNQ